MATPNLLFQREEELRDSVSSYAKRKGFTHQYRELPFYDYRIDIYGLSRPRGETIAIELKLKDWRRALYQAMIYQLCSDFVFIALPETKAQKIDHAELAKHGVGLIVVGEHGRCRTSLEATRSTEVREHYRREYTNMLASVRNEPR